MRTDYTAASVLRMAILVPVTLIVVMPATGMPATGMAQPAPPPISEEAIETTARRARELMAASVSRNAPSKPTLQDALPATRRTIGDVTVVLTPSGGRLGVTVNTFEDGVGPQDARNPPAGRWVLADWTVKNEGPRDASVNRLHFRVQTTEGYVFGPSLEAVHESALESARLEPGQAVRGWLSYDIPSGVPIASLIYQAPGEPQFIIANLMP